MQQYIQFRGKYIASDSLNRYELWLIHKNENKIENIVALVKAYTNKLIYGCTYSPEIEELINTIILSKNIPKDESIESYIECCLSVS
jgi:hypothetical protein